MRFFIKFCLTIAKTVIDKLIDKNRKHKRMTRRALVALTGGYFMNTLQNIDRTKVNFLQLRKSLGVSRQMIAHALYVQERSTQRWEDLRDLDSHFPPEDAWEYLFEMSRTQDDEVRFAIEKVKELEKERGKRPERVTLVYYLTQKEYAEYHRPRDGGSYKYANIVSARTARALRREGYVVDFVTPQESATTTAAKGAGMF